MNVRQTRRIPQTANARSGLNIMGPNTTFLTGTDFNVRAAKVGVLSIEGTFSTAGGNTRVWLQFFTSLALPANNSVPLISIPIDLTVSPTGYFLYDVSTDVQLIATPLTWALSTTQR